MITIIVGPVKSKVQCNLKSLIKLRELTRIRNKNAFFLRKGGHVGKGWDGFVYYVTEAGYFQTGLLQQIVETIKKEFTQDISFIDERDETVVYSIKEGVGDYTFRGYQRDSISAVLENYIDGLHLPLGVLFAATNAGKTLIAAGLHSAIQDNMTVLLINQKDLFDDAMKDMPNMLGKENVGWIHSKDIKWAPFMICMVPTLRNRLSLIYNKLGLYKTIIFDECDTATAPTNKKVVGSFMGAVVKVGMSGSVGTHKDKNKNMLIHQMFGSIVYTIKNRDLIDLGFSSEVKVEIHTGNRSNKFNGDYDQEYERGIIKNKTRNTTIINRLTEKAKDGQLPALIITPRHEHIKILYKRIKEKLGMVYKVEMVHHKTPNRKQIQEDFTNGKIDILIGSYILKRGKNFKKMRYLSNAGGGDSVANVLQILGRAMRKELSDGEEETKYLDDFWDEGSYLRRHSLHRSKVYKKEQLQVKEVYKGTI